MKSFEKWWSEEGSAMRPMPTEDVEEFAKRIAMIAWSNGAYKATEQPEPVPGAFNPGNFDAIATIATQPAAQRKPLTDKEIIRAANALVFTNLNAQMQYIAFARAIEAAHGIKEGT